MQNSSSPIPPQYGAPPAPVPPTNAGKPGLNLQPNVAAALSYIFVMGIVVLITEKENRFVRFHAAQSVVLGVVNLVSVVLLLFAAFGVPILLTLIGAGISAGGPNASDAGAGIALIGFLFFFVGMALISIVPLLMLCLLIVCAVKAYNNKTLRLPIVARIADRLAFRQSV